MHSAAKKDFKRGYCPVCDTKASGPNKPLAVADDSDPYFTNVGWMPDLKVNVCKKCGNVFVVETK